MKARRECPKCRSRQIRVDRFTPLATRAVLLDFGPVPAFHPQRLLAYTCTGCGFVELYFDPTLSDTAP